MLKSLIFSFLRSYSFKASFVEANSSSLIHESISALKTLYYLTYFILTILFDHASSFYLIIDLDFLIRAAIAQIFNATTELVEIPSAKGKPETETHPLTAEAKIRKGSI